LSLVLCALAAAMTGSGQDQASIIMLESANCEVDESNFNVVRVDALKSLGENSFLIAIARFGSTDKAQALNRQRLSATKEWMSNAAFPINKLVLAEGERVNGNGRVEFYIGGKLTHVILPKPNMGLCTECCNPRPEDFTSDRRKKRRR